MIDWNALITGGVGAAIVAGIFGIVMYKLKRRDEKTDEKSLERKALCYLMLYIIEERGQKLLTDGQTTLSELRRLHHWHKVYKALGGNGDADSLMKRLEALPIVDE